MDDELLVSLSSAERTELCEYFNQELGGPHTLTCPNGDTVTFEDTTACEMGFAKLLPSCAATVEEAKACVAVVAHSPCSEDPGQGSACEPLLRCSN